MASPNDRVTPPAVALRGAQLGFGGHPLFAGVDLPVAKGDRLCLVGRNGSGKSTLLKALSGEIDLDAGERFVQPGARIAYLPQDPRPPADHRVFDYVAGGLPPAPEGIPRDHLVEAALAGLGLDGERRMGTLSGGETRRAALARALVSGPDVLLLDEPTASLDPSAKREIETLLAELANQGITLLMASHNLGQVKRLAQRIVYLEQGRVLADVPAARFFDGAVPPEAKLFLKGELPW